MDAKTRSSFLLIRINRLSLPGVLRSMREKHAFFRSRLKTATLATYRVPKVENENNVRFENCQAWPLSGLIL